MKGVKKMKISRLRQNFVFYLNRVGILTNA